MRFLDESEMVSRPALMSSSLWPFSSTDLAIASEREAMGETVFMISCVSTRMSLVQESCS